LPAVTGLRLEKLLSAFSKNQYQVLMYHGVVKNKNLNLSANHCSISEFEEEIKYLKSNFEIISLHEIFERHRNGFSPKRKTIAITFDDGYENNYTNAFEILKKYKAPATIFVVASCVTNPEYLLWYDYVDLIKNEIDFSDFSSLKIDLPSDKLKELHNINELSRFKLFLKSINTDFKNLVLEKIISREKAGDIISKTDIEFRKMLSGKQMKEMTDSGLIEIGSHSLTHPNLDTLPDEQLRIELVESKKLLESVTGKEIESIAFPDGAYNETVKSLSLQSGYKNLLAVDYRLPSDVNDSRILQRFCISNSTTAESNIIQIHSGFNNWGF